MKKISCPKCEREWDENATLKFTIDIECNTHKRHYVVADLEVRDFTFCPYCYFRKRDDNYRCKADRVVLKQNGIKIKSIVVEDEYGRYLNMSVKDFQDLRLSSFNPDPEEDDDHTSVWGGAGPDCNVTLGEPA